ncbi:hypothetical protein [Streptomyces boninensis]|uniref:hypothetical protein n=1 Tax=Streptomyces boninensis TaxID=2039455 RepID=UPI003B21943F
MSAAAEVRPRDRFAIFAECLLTGIWIAVAALPLLTLPAALAAGARHLHRLLAYEQTGLRQYAADFRAAARRGLAAGCGCVLAAALLTADIAAARAGVPGAQLAGAVGGLGLLALTVVVLRAAVRWEPDASWRALFAAAIRRTVADPVGSCLLLSAPLVVGVSAALSLPLVAPALGMAVAAAIAVERRRESPG